MRTWFGCNSNLTNGGRNINTNIMFLLAEDSTCSQCTVATFSLISSLQCVPQPGDPEEQWKGERNTKNLHPPFQSLSLKNKVNITSKHFKNMFHRWFFLVLLVFIHCSSISRERPITQCYTFPAGTQWWFHHGQLNSRTAALSLLLTEEQGEKT